MIIEDSVGKFFNHKKGDIKDDEILTIASEGKIRDNYKFPNKDGSPKKEKLFLVKKSDGSEANVKFNPTTTDNLKKCYGKDTIKWVGKKVIVKSQWMPISGESKKVVYFLHQNTEFDNETGKWIIRDLEKIQQENNITVETNEQPPITDEQIKENLEDFDNIQ